MERIIARLKGFPPILSKLWLAVAFFLVAVLSFEAGVLKKSLKENEPVVIAVPNTVKPAAVPARLKTDSVSAPVTSVTSEVGKGTSILSGKEVNCVFVGSKNSNKYHDPNSRCAKQIKVENRVCFASVEQATVKGYIVGCLK